MVKREGHLKQIEGYVTEELRRIAPEGAKRYLVKGEQIKNYYSFYLVPKKNPERKAEIMQLNEEALYRKAETVKGTLAFSMLKFRLSRAIKNLQTTSKKKNEEDTSGLERFIAVISGIGILGSLFFLSPNITGNAISNLTTKTTSFLGVGLLIIGLVAGFFWLKRRKK